MAVLPPIQRSLTSVRTLHIVYVRAQSEWMREDRLHRVNHLPPDHL